MAPGWFGKVPALGDFVSRRLPATFVAGWDAWLRASLEASRAALGDAWHDVYLSSPLWRFAVMPGCLDDQAWLGVLMPSVDRVGRCFPLTIAQALPDAGSALDAMIGAGDWFRAVEAAALGALDATSGSAALEDRLARIGPAVRAKRAPSLEEQTLQRFWQGETSSGVVMTFNDEWALADAIAWSLGDHLAARTQARSLWWLVSETAGPVRMRCFLGLPPPGCHAALLSER